MAPVKKPEELFPYKLRRPFLDGSTYYPAGAIVHLPKRKAPSSAVKVVAKPAPAVLYVEEDDGQQGSLALD